MISPPDNSLTPFGIAPARLPAPWSLGFPFRGPQWSEARLPVILWHIRDRPDSSDAHSRLHFTDVVPEARSRGAVSRGPPWSPVGAETRFASVAVHRLFLDKHEAN